jgi:hypothetical protein
MPGGPTMKIMGLRGVCREVKGLESLGVSIGAQLVERWNPGKLGGCPAASPARGARSGVLSLNQPVRGNGVEPVEPDRSLLGHAPRHPVGICGNSWGAYNPAKSSKRARRRSSLANSLCIT